MPANLLLEKFGEKFLDFCQDSGYDRILQVLGATPRDFLQVYPPMTIAIQFKFVICMINVHQRRFCYSLVEFGRPARPSGHE